jgi:ABC-type branched-subunit amino acid transport system substrate-binding protein
MNSSVSPRFLAIRPAVVAALIASALVLSPAAEAGKKRPVAPDLVEDALAFATTDRARAIKLLEEAIAQNPGATDLSTLMVHAGEQRRLSGDLVGARQWFVKASQSASGSDVQAAKLGITLIDAGDALDDRATTALMSAPEKEVLATQNADRYLFLAIDAGTRKDTRGVSSYSKKALSYAKDDPELERRVEEAVAALEAAQQSGAAPDPGLMSRQSPAEKADALYLAGDLAGARKEAEKAVSGAEGPEKARMEGLIKTIDSGDPLSNKIAVLLPLSDKYAAVGKQVQEALSFGYGSGSRQLVFLDTGSTPETAVAALERAVTTEHAIAVVGPLLTDETDAVVEAAENMHVPLLSLSQAYEDTAGKFWSLQAMYTRADQIDALLDYAMGAEKQMKAFAIFAPDSPFGIRAAESFRAAVEARGGTITTEAKYPAEETNLIDAAKTLGTRVGDIEVLRAQAKKAGHNPDTVVVPPQLDFDGIFIPENATKTPLACAALAFEEFPMGEFTPVRGQKKIPLLGLAGWNNTNLVAAGNEYTRNSLFPDVFSAIVAGEADPFVTEYKAALGRTPSALEAATVDAGRLLAAAAKSSADTRPEFREALLAATNPNAVTGATKFDPQTLRVNRRMLILTITRTTIDDVATVNVE